MNKKGDKPTWTGQVKEVGRRIPNVKGEGGQSPPGNIAIPPSLALEETGTSFYEGKEGGRLRSGSRKGGVVIMGGRP